MEALIYDWVNKLIQISANYVSRKSMQIMIQLSLNFSCTIHFCSIFLNLNSNTFYYKQHKFSILFYKSHFDKMIIALALTEHQHNANWIFSILKYSSVSLVRRNILAKTKVVLVCFQEFRSCVLYSCDGYLIYEICCELGMLNSTYC